MIPPVPVLAVLQRKRVCGSPNGTTVLVDSAVGAAVLLCDAAMVVCVAVSVGAADGRSSGPGAEGDSEPLGGDCCIKPVAADKAPYWPSTPRASVSAS